MKDIDKIRASVKSYCKEVIAKMPHILPNFFNLSEAELDHIYDIAASVVLTRDEIMYGGSFVQAVVNNDLEQAVSRADTTVGQALQLFIIVKQNFIIR
ncbi:MAG TPA: hypothetical protein P5509_01500 [Bacteroidales bacterium]|mgnify:CR=1 FL=1|nr:hypothetical protein [Bacteroidales bacterium]